MTLLQARPGGSSATRPAPGSHHTPGSVHPALRHPAAGRHPAAAALLDAGLITPADAAQASVRDLSRAHPVTSVRTPSASFVVKQHAPERGADLGVEFFVYRMAAWCEPVRAALPTAHLVDEDAHLLVLEDLAGASLAVRAGFAPQLGMAAPAVDPGWLATTAGRLGATLGDLHRGTAALPLPPARPPLALGVLSGLASPTGRLGELTAPLASDPLIADAARSLCGPVAGCLVSHDMKWDNVVVRPDGRVVLIDWELGGLGDPAIDLGFLLAEHLVRSSPDALDDPARALLSGYAEAARPRPDAIGLVARRTASAAGLRIAQLAVEVADTHGGEPPASLLDLARATLRRVDALTDEVSRCLT